MPTGIITNRVNCKKCNKKFNNLSNLRKHQWAAHREMYANAFSGKEWKPEQRAKFEVTMAAKKAIRLGLVKVKANSNSEVHTGGLSALDLLNKLKEQQKFMHDVVSLISGIITQHSEWEQNKR